jgi:hypothetical protein
MGQIPKFVKEMNNRRLRLAGDVQRLFQLLGDERSLTISNRHEVCKKRIDANGYKRAELLLGMT